MNDIKPKHTETSWKIDPEHPAGILNGKNMFIANCHYTSKAKANAERIVHCVNLHDELVEAAKAALEQCDFLDAPGVDEMLELAIKKAEGK